MTSFEQRKAGLQSDANCLGEIIKSQKHRDASGLENTNFSTTENHSSSYLVLPLPCLNQLWVIHSRLQSNFPQLVFFFFYSREVEDLSVAIKQNACKMTRNDT